MSRGVDNPTLELEEPSQSTDEKQVTIDMRSDSKYGATDDASKPPLKTENDAKTGHSTGNEQKNDTNCFTQAIVDTKTCLSNFMTSHVQAVNRSVKVLLLLLYNVYLVAAIHYNVTYNKPIGWCDGVGFLIIVTAVVYIGLVYYEIVLRFYSKTLSENCLQPLDRLFSKIWSFKLGRLRPVQLVFFAGLLATIIIFLIVDTADNRSRLVSALGLVVLVLLGFIFSKNPGKVIWRQIFWGIALQLILALFILRSSLGRRIFDCLGEKVRHILDFTDAGSSFVFGYLVDKKPLIPTALNSTSVAAEVANDFSKYDAFKFVFFFKVLSVIYFFSFCISILYYYGVMQLLVKKVGWFLQVTMGTTAAESMSVAANIFIGQSEAPLMIKPYLPVMTNSEIHAVMTGGFATIAGTVLAAYVSFGVSASHLMTASVMSAPAALAYAKLFYPETEVSRTNVKDITVEKGKETNALDAASQGAMYAATIVLYIAANLIAVIAFIEFLNVLIGWFGGLLGIDYLSFEYILGKVFIPLAWLMGVDYKECEYVAKLVGLKTVVNEFVAYERLKDFKKLKLLSPRSEVIAIYALCGFSNPGSIGIQLGALGAMAESRKSDFAKVAFRAFLAGSAACFLTACVAGILLQEPSFSTVAAGGHDVAVNQSLSRSVSAMM